MTARLQPRGRSMTGCSTTDGDQAADDEAISSFARRNGITVAQARSLVGTFTGNIRGNRVRTQAATRPRKERPSAEVSREPPSTERQIDHMNRLDEITARAYKLARSGDYVDCPSVRSALEREGYPDARFALDDPVVKAHVAGLCSEHRHGKTAETSRQIVREQKPA